MKNGSGLDVGTQGRVRLVGVPNVTEDSSRKILE